VLTASYIVGGIGIAALLTSRVIRAWRRVGEFINEVRAELAGMYDVPLGEDEITEHERSQPC
jgi:hypothetical protein